MNRWLLDSDTTSYVLRRQPPFAVRYRQAVSDGDTFVLSPVVHFEVTRNLKRKRASRIIREYLGLIDAWEPVDLLLTDWNRAADLWAKRYQAGKGITDADLLISVCALKAGATLVTNNTRHFQGLGLSLVNWASP